MIMLFHFANVIMYLDVERPAFAIQGRICYIFPGSQVTTPGNA